MVMNRYNNESDPEINSRSYGNTKQFEARSTRSVMWKSGSDWERGSQNHHGHIWYNKYELCKPPNTITVPLPIEVAAFYLLGKKTMISWRHWNELTYISQSLVKKSWQLFEERNFYMENCKLGIKFFSQVTEKIKWELWGLIKIQDI